MTLIELLVAAGVAAIVLSALCEVYLISAKSWQRQQSQETALRATSQACSSISGYVHESVDALLVSRLDDEDALALCLPADTARGIYVPVWVEGVLEYRPGTWVIFYLSDSTGDYLRTGDILWAGTFADWGGFPMNVVPDASWSLYYNNQAGRITPIESLDFSVSESGERWTVTTMVSSSYRVGNSVRHIVQTRTECMRNKRNTL